MGVIETRYNIIHEAKLVWWRPNVDTISKISVSLQVAKLVYNMLETQLHWRKSSWSYRAQSNLQEDKLV